MYLAEISVLGKVETSQINIASLVPMNCPAEVGWHMRGLTNNGGSMEELKEAFRIAKRVCEACQVVLKKELPRVEDVVGKERLIRGTGELILTEFGLVFDILPSKLAVPSAIYTMGSPRNVL
jgi:hypothetical protein